MEAIKLVTGVTPTCWRVNMLLSPVWKHSLTALAYLIAPIRRRRWSYSRHREWLRTSDSPLEIWFAGLAIWLQAQRHSADSRWQLSDFDKRCKFWDVCQCEYTASSQTLCTCVYHRLILGWHDYSDSWIEQFHNEWSDEVLSFAQNSIQG